jgi:hypothetical protein
MHYSPYGFSKYPHDKSKPTMTAKINPRKNNQYMGQRNNLSKDDVVRINRMYECAGKVMDFIENDDDDESDDDDDDSDDENYDNNDSSNDDDDDDDDDDESEEENDESEENNEVSDESDE